LKGGRAGRSSREQSPQRSGAKEWSTRSGGVAYQMASFLVVSINANCFDDRDSGATNFYLQTLDSAKITDVDAVYLHQAYLFTVDLPQQPPSPPLLIGASGLYFD